MDSPAYKDLTGLKGYTFVIPYQQRGYKWTPKNIKFLIQDLLEFVSSDKKSEVYCLQPLAVVKVDEKRYEVLDGQQRLTTFYLLNKVLNGEEAFEFDFERDKGNERMCFLRNVGIFPESMDFQRLPIDEYHIAKAYASIDKIDDKEKNILRRLLNGEIDNKRVKFIWYEVDAAKDDEAAKHKEFLNLNQGKIELTNSDLIKALLLNEEGDNENYNSSLIASQFDSIARDLKEDDFWFMLQNDEASYQSCRMDLIFNLAEKIEKSVYDRNNIASFEKFASSKGLNQLKERWQKVTDIFLRLKDFYNDIEAYHYIGYLTYCNSSTSLSQWIDLRKSKKRSEFIETLENKISDTLAHGSVKEFSYDDTKQSLRRLFVLHNIATIVHNFKKKKANSLLGIRNPNERFPFELLYRQVWHIEHIASQQDNDLGDKKSQETWLLASRSDFPDIFSMPQIQIHITNFEKEKDGPKDSRDASFKTLYNSVIDELDKRLKDKKIKDKNIIGNLVLLDSKSNVGYKNALYPAKRRWVIENYDKYYYPPCTVNIFMKFYNPQSELTTQSWNKDDARHYVEHMEKTLEKFF